MGLLAQDASPDQVGDRPHICLPVVSHCSGPRKWTRLTVLVLVWWVQVRLRDKMQDRPGKIFRDQDSVRQLMASKLEDTKDMAMQVGGEVGRQVGD